MFLLMFLVYIWVAYKTDQQKKSNFIKNHQINKVRIYHFIVSQF